MIELKYAGVATLENGAETYHLTATANGPDMTPLFGGLISPVGTVAVEAFIDKTTRAPARFLITEHDTPAAATQEAGAESEPIVWTIDLYDIDAPSQIVPPQAATAESASATEADVAATEADVAATEAVASATEAVASATESDAAATASATEAAP
jgi:hypothetical protein